MEETDIERMDKWANAIIETVASNRRKNKAFTAHVGKETIPCPFCGDDRIFVAKAINGWVANCLKCHSRTGLHKDRESAVKAWNRRV